MWQMIGKSVVRRHPHHAYSTDTQELELNVSHKITDSDQKSYSVLTEKSGIWFRKLWWRFRVIEFGSKTCMSFKKVRGLLSF